MIVKKLSVLSSVSIGSNICAVVKKEQKNIDVVILDNQLNLREELTALPGSRAFILWGDESRLLIGVDDRLILFEDGNSKAVLEARPGNFFWHSIVVNDKVFVQEYGEPPTGIYVSEDLVSWVRVVDNLSVDKSSKHFHYIGYDPYRDWLIATLGDGNLVRVIYSPDHGKSWKPLYKGPWQFVPFAVLEDKLVFGFDSGIARGGVGIYHPARGSWQFIFFEPMTNVRYMRFSDLLYVRELDMYVAAFGSPQLFAVSRDLVYWHPLLVEGYDADYNYHMGLLRVGDYIIGWTGSSIFSVSLSELRKFLETQPVSKPYKAYIDKLKGLLFTMRRRLWKKGLLEFEKLCE